MLNQLEQLSVNAEGRYATAQELQFLKDYFSTVNVRLSAYQKIRDSETEIIEQLRIEMLEQQPDIFKVGDRDLTPLYERDTRIVLRIATAAMSIDDLDRVRDNILLWQRTIVKAFQVKHIAALAHSTMPEIIEGFLTAEEYVQIRPILMLNRAVLTD